MTKVFLVSLLASLGGAAVAWGLFLESFAEKPKFSDVKDFRSSKQKAHSGQKWVFWGVVAEVVIAFALAAWEGSEMIDTNRRIETAAPENQTIASVTAQVNLEVAGTSHWDNDKVAHSYIEWCKPEHLNFGPIMVCSHSENPFPGLFVLSFDTRNPAEFGESTKVGEATNWTSVVITAPFLSKGAVIDGGIVYLTANSKVFKFSIPPQKARSKSEWIEFANNPKQSVTVFCE
jgi:hypothetical protein